MAQFYPDEDIIELSSDRCPASHQNRDYLNYVLTVLTMESKVMPPPPSPPRLSITLVIQYKHEAWEDEETGSYLDFKWERSQQKERLMKLLSPEIAKAEDKAS